MLAKCLYTSHDCRKWDHDTYLNVGIENNTLGEQNPTIGSEDQAKKGKDLAKGPMVARLNGEQASSQ